jgi:predicted PurR-regulated permease PerM
MTGFFVWLFLTIIGMDFPLIWGALAFFLNFIPNLGSIVFVVVVIIMAILQYYPELGMVVPVAISMTMTQLVIGNFLDPKMQGERLNLSPVVIIISLLFWGWLWGITGAIISVPIAAIIKIICENVPFLRPVSILMETGKERKRKRRVLK